MQNIENVENLAIDTLLADYRRLTELQALVSSILSNLVHCAPSDVARTIEESLLRIGEVVCADRAYIFERVSEDRLRNTHEWCAPGIQPEIDNLQDLPLDVTHFWLHDLMEDRPVHVPEVAALPEELSATREVLESQDIKSLLVVPMLNRGHLLGIVGFDSVRERRAFVAGEVSLLQSVANLICAALLRQKMSQEMAAAEAELNLQRERFRIIADTVSDVLWDHDLEGHTWWMSKDWPEKLRIVARASDGDPSSWFERVHPDDREKLRSSFHDLLRSDSDFWEVEYRVIGDDGNALDICVKATVFRSPAGRVLRMLGNARNITQERRRLEGYSRARALETVGQLTGGIAHDFNNLLMIIIGNTELLESQNLDSDTAETVAMISSAAESAASLTRKLLTFAQQDQLNVTTIDMNKLMSDTMSLLRSGFPESIVFVESVPPELWKVRADPNGLQQAVINIAMNSNDAMPRGGEIELTCANVEFGVDAQIEAADLAPGRYVVISLSDTGSGMAASTLSRAFEPFFTTKDVGKGTGLGLSAVHGFARQSGGCASISSEQGRGTRVSLYLPASDGDAEHQTQPQFDTGFAFKPSRKRILLVEDEPQVRAHVEKTLVRLGHDVTAASDAASALSMAQNGAAFDLLFTDIIMPGDMNGQELGEALSRLDPNIKIIYTSGYPAEAFEHIGISELSSINFLSKPYRISQLSEKIAETLKDS